MHALATDNQREVSHAGKIPSLMGVLKSELWLVLN